MTSQRNKGIALANRNDIRERRGGSAEQGDFSHIIQEIRSQIFVDFIHFHSTIDLKRISDAPSPVLLRRITYENSAIVLLELFDDDVQFTIFRSGSIFADVDQCRTRTDLNIERERRVFSFGKLRVFHFSTEFFQVDQRRGKMVDDKARHVAHRLDDAPFQLIERQKSFVKITVMNMFERELLGQTFA